MNTKTIVICGAIALGTYVFSTHDNQHDGFVQEGEKSRPGFIINMDDSGVLSEPAKAQQLKLMLLAQLKNLSHKRKFAHARLNIISSSHGRTIWVGQVKDLNSKRAEEIISKIAANAKYCNKLEQSFHATKSAISKLENQGFDDIHFIGFSSLIATPAPCSETKSITLPQLPVSLDFADIFTSSSALSSISFYYVNPHQLNPYMQALKPVQVWAEGNDVIFNMFEAQETEFHLSMKLTGVK